LRQLARRLDVVLIVSRRFTCAAAALGLLLLAPGEARGQTPGDNPWTIVDVDREDLPADFIPPADFLALTLDQSLLEELLADAPRESFGQVPSDVFVPLPLPDETFAVGGVASSSLMEPALAAQFPEIQTWVFHDLLSGASGHLALGPGGFHAALRNVGKLVKIEPVQTSAGLVYLSYEDALRLDGANEIHFPPGEHDHDDPPPPVPVVAPAGVAAAVTSGTQLRVYRLAAATTGELYQARGGNDLSVLFSIIVDVLGANAVFEPEVATRLIIALASLDVFYSNPATDPFFNGPPVCSVNGNACTSDDDCDTDNGETCSIRTTCGLRDDNRDNMIALHNNATIDHSEYDLSVLTAVSRPGVRGGCAWYVVCLEGNTDHKARGMVTSGSGGTGSTSGVLAHEVGHMLGARHTFTGQDGSCTVGEFFAGNSQSGYEPGSGTTRMSYNGNCDSDNVDVSADPPSDQYFHSRSFDEIVDNVFNGDGASCGSLINTGNLPPVVDAGPDYAIPRMTPFLLSPASYSDAQMAALTFNWEQYDRAIVQRPIDTDFAIIFFGVDFGPIIRSVAPVPESTRTVPNLTDLLDGTSQPPASINRAGEMLPQVDRTLDFRFIARDNEMGGGGVAYDDITLTVEGDPFYLTTQNGGESLDAGCTAVATWEVGGSDVAPVSAASVDLSFSEDGGSSFSPLLAATPNDGGQAYTVPCTSTSTARLRAQGTGNIFFDISDADFSVASEAPQISGSATGGEVDEQCEFEVTFEATVTDDCGVAAADVEVEVTETTGNATLGTPTVNVAQNGGTAVDVSGSVLVSDLTTSPAQVRVRIDAEDGCGLIDSEDLFADVSDTTPPTIEVVLDPDLLWPPNHQMKDITAEVTAVDNCGSVSFVLDSVTSDEPDDTTGDGSTINDIQGTQLGTADLFFQLRAERLQAGDGRIYTATYTATDGSDNETSDSDQVQVPKSKKP
jgi:hypothetical protein